MSDCCCNKDSQTNQDSDCCSSNQNMMLLSCSGGSNVGQLANRACVELTQEGFGQMFCLAGVGAELSGFVQSCKDVPEMVVIDGCEIGCAKKSLEKVGINPLSYFVITKLGIDKNKDFNLKEEDIVKVKQTAKLMASPMARLGSGTKKGCCCG